MPFEQGFELQSLASRMSPVAKEDDLLRQQEQLVMGLVLLRRRRVRLVLMAGALNKGDEGRVLLHAILNPRSHRVGSKGKDLVNPVRMSHPSR
jgi:hypothetical protein